MIGCRAVNSTCEPDGIVGPLRLSLFLSSELSGKEVDLRRVLSIPTFCLPLHPRFHAALSGWSLFFLLNFLILLLHLLLQFPWQMQKYGCICGRHGLFGPIQNLCDRIPRSR
ncbi:hypothetical protein CaCOL14_003688 [Colletotrichum acutatum]